MMLHIFAAPHTKVEETLQVNNIYDHMYLQDDLANYDFVEFPGVVYRTFISSLLIAGIDFPIKFIVEYLGLTSFTMLLVCKLYSLYKEF